MPVSPSSRPYLAFWGTIQAGTAVRASTAELWAEIRGFAAEEGIRLGAGAFQAVSEMRSIAAAIRNGGERFRGAAQDEPFSPLMAAPDINVRDPATRAILPEYLVRFDLTYIDREGQTQTRTVSMRQDWTPDLTVGDVYDQVADAADGLAREYGTSLVGVANMTPVMV